MVQRLEQLRGGLIVSCQAPRNSPMRDPRIIAAIALSAQRSGAVALRINGLDHIEAVRATCSLPIIGLVKRVRPGRGQVITPSVDDALRAIEAGADIVAIDAMNDRTEADSRRDIVEAIHASGALVMADVAAIRDAIDAHRDGADIVASTMAPPPGNDPDEPDFALVEALRRELPEAFIIAEGRIASSRQLAQAFSSGASSVVVGTAITDPLRLTAQFVAATPRSLASDLSGRS